MKLLVLGSAAGGGFPQWNCNCSQCAGVRAGRPGLQRRTQSSLAVGGPHDWLLVNASPDILQQIGAQAQLQAARAVRDSGICGVLLSDGQIDHVTGLLMLRELGRPLPLWCSASVHEDLSVGFPLLQVLGHFCGVEHHRIQVGGPRFSVPELPTLRIDALPAPSQPAPYSPGRGAPRPDDNLAFVFENLSSGRRIFYAPGLARVDETLRQAMCSADTVLVDGTFWCDTEMRDLGFSSKHAYEIGHLSLAGPTGMLAQLAALPSGTRKLLIHINNTNPVLDEHSPERRACTEAGVEVCIDGLELAL